MPPRAYAARLLWQLDAADGEARSARLIVIESYAAERQGESAFRTMLRFDQDYRPLSRNVTERFVERLLDLGLDKEAVNWLAGLDDAGALKLRLRFRTGLVTPDAAIAQARAQLAKAGKVGGGADYWQVRFAVMQWRAGEVEAAANTMRALVKPAKSLPAPASSRALALAREMLDAGKPGPAEELYAALLPLAGRGDARDILVALGGIAESAAQHARAADYFLRAALVDESRATDSLALRARLSAALNLARAGYKEDARAQFQWLLKHAKEPDQIDAARQALSRL